MKLRGRGECSVLIVTMVFSYDWLADYHVTVATSLTVFKLMPMANFEYISAHRIRGNFFPIFVTHIAKKTSFGSSLAVTPAHLQITSLIGRPALLCCSSDLFLKWLLGKLCRRRQDILKMFKLIELSSYVMRIYDHDGVISWLHGECIYYLLCH